MANKNKIINVAQKHIQRGQYDKAIRELNKLIEEDPRDVRTLLKIGDIYSKKGDREEATKVYRRVAEFYAEQGFFLKAVAVYKQILKYDPDELEVTFKLAELYEHLGLTQEAMAQYQNVAIIHDESGNSREALTVLARMVELDPTNVASRVRLAEAYSRENMIAEAIEEFALASDTLKSQNRTADYVKVAERLVYHDPSRLDVIKELARDYMGRADNKRALAKLQLAFKADPRDVETLNMLASAFLELGQLPKTVFVYRELAKLYDDTGQRDDARVVYRRILELQPGDQQASEALGLAPPVPQPVPSAPVVGVQTPASPPAQPAVAAIPAAPPVARAIRRVSAPVRAANADQTAKLLTETDVYIKYGLKDKAIEHLRKVLELDPEATAAYEKMRDIHKNANDTARAGEAIASLMRLQHRLGDPMAVEVARQQLAGLVPSHPLATPGANLEGDEGVDIDIDMSTGSFDRSSLGLGSSSAPRIVHAPRDPADGPGTEEMLSGVSPESFAIDDDLDVDEFVEISNFDFASQPARSKPVLVEDIDDDDDDVQPLGGTIFFDSGRPVDGRHLPSTPPPGVEALIASSTEPRDGPLTMELPIMQLPSELSPGDLDDELEEELDSAEFFAQQGLVQEAKDSIRDVLKRNPTYLRALEMIARLDLDDGGQTEAAPPRLHQPSNGHASDDQYTEAPTAKELAAIDDDDHNGSTRVFAAPAFDESDGDLEARFDLGHAYREMGMFEEAINEFQVAAQSPSRTVEAFAQIGHCLRAQGDTNGAVGYFFTALESGADPKLAVELKYETGAAYDEAGDIEKALYWYGTAYKDDPKFRDVRDRIVALGGDPEDAFATDDALEAVKKDDSPNGP